MASRLQQLQSKACQASKFVAKHGTAYYKQLLEQNKQYIQEPPTVEKCNELSKQLFYTRLASIPGRSESFWKELDYVKNLWKNRQELKVEDAGIAALFGLECFAWFCAGEIVGRGFTFTGYYAQSIERIPRWQRTSECLEGRSGNFIIPPSGLPRSIEKRCWTKFYDDVNHKCNSRKKKKKVYIGRRIGDKMLPGAVVPARARLIATFAFIFAFLTVFADSVTNDSQVKCSRTCIAENCNSVGIRYGKYCGVGWSGCPGEKPCDDLDACCKIHDECVEKKGLINVKCHEKFKSCIKKVQKSGKVGFSCNCPIETAVPTMMQGMDMAILLSRLGSTKLDEL
ncbi:hypothetical protein CRYUN_Cryun03dG0010300 [Craigia yunnanensis]